MTISNNSSKEETLKKNIMVELLAQENRMLIGKSRRFHSDESLAMEGGIVGNPDKEEGPFRMMLHYLQEEGMINIEVSFHVSHTKGTTRLPAEVTLTPKGREWARKMAGPAIK